MTSNQTNTDQRQRFFIQNTPVRGDVVRLTQSYATIIAQKDYPEAIKRLLGEMLTAASLLIGTLKIKGSLSIQLQSSDAASLLNWAMAECNQDGMIRALASWEGDGKRADDYWHNQVSADAAFAELGAHQKGVLFINIRPDNGEGYQGIVERTADNLAGCLAHYQHQSAQIPTVVNLACDGLQAGGILVQQLPRTFAEEQAHDAAQHAGDVDGDLDELWRRITVLTQTLKQDELTTLPASDIIYRLYHEEEAVVPDATALAFGCTCSSAKCKAAILHIGHAEAMSIVQEDKEIAMDCGFCGAMYRFDIRDVQAVFADSD